MRRTYTRLDQKELDAAMEDFPPLDTKRCEQQANSLFKTWIFVRDKRGMREISCSSCGHSEQLLAPLRTMDERWAQLLYAGHDEPARCPWCGADGRIKERRYIREGVKLTEFHPVVFLQEAGGVLYAQGFWATKSYNGQMSAKELCQAPLFMETAAYRFRLGCAEVYTREEYSEKYYCQRVKGNYSRKNWIREPFTTDYTHTMGCAYPPYRVFGWEALERSELKYCQYELYRHGQRLWQKAQIEGDLMKYLTVYTQYPMQVERLMKAGWRDLVKDLVIARKKNKAILKWEEPDLLKALGLTGQEFKAWRESGGSPYRIGDYKRMRRAGIKASFAEIAELKALLSFEYENGVKYCEEYGIRPARLARYIAERSGKGAERHCATAAMSYWRDYIDTCRQLGYDLTNETVLLPKLLKSKHDEAAKELRDRKEREAREQERQEKLKAADRLEKWRKKYTAEVDGFIIRPAESSREIIEEGKAMQHCVGGYAERHMAGKLTICFMRRVETPEASLYTIEMHGTDAIQIRAYRNADPKPVARRAYERWLDWLRKGSKRDKQGNPILPKIKEKEAKTA